VDIDAFRMIKIRIVAVGKVKEKYFSEAIAEYAKRLSRYCEFSVAEVKEENYDKATPSAIEKILSVEGERIEKAIKGLPVCPCDRGQKDYFGGLRRFHKKQNGQRRGRNNLYNRRKLRHRRADKERLQG